MYSLVSRVEDKNHHGLAASQTYLPSEYPMKVKISPLSAAPLGGLLVSRPLGSSGDHFLWLYDLLTIFAEKKAPNTNFKGTVWNFALKKSMQKINNNNNLLP